MSDLDRQLTRLGAPHGRAAGWPTHKTRARIRRRNRARRAAKARLDLERTEAA